MIRLNYDQAPVFNRFQLAGNNYQKQIITSQNTQNTDVFQTKQNKKVAACTLFGAIAPVVALNLIKGKGGCLIDTFKSNSSLKQKAKSLFNIFEIDDFKGILASTTGAIGAGVVLGAVLDKNPDNKKEKTKEGIFEFLNCMIPTVFTLAGEVFSNKTGKLNSAPARAAKITASVAGGMFIANKASNKINEKYFNQSEQEKRKFKITDCVVHLDDVISLLVIAHVPFAKSLQADKILPVLYAHSGYEAAVAKSEKPSA